MPFFSIIVPIYNASEYLDRCFESILSQTYTSFEVLAIDDGSTDHSLQLCNMWVQKDQRIRVFHQENRGASAARNVGLCNALGQYIQFVDSDDTLEPDCLQHISNLIQENNYPDVVEFRLNYIAPNGMRNIQGTTLPEGLYEKEYLQETFLPVMLNVKEDPQIYYNIFNVLRIIRREPLFVHHITFNESIRRWEDWLFAMEVFNQADQMLVTQKAVYNYYGHVNGGLGGRYAPDTYLYVIEAFCILDNLVGKKYDMFSPYAVRQKVNLLERCIWEISRNESGVNQQRALLDIIRNAYFTALLHKADSRDGIFCLQPFVIRGDEQGALNKLNYYLRFTSYKQRIREHLSVLYHKYLKRN